MKKCASCTKDLPDAALHCVFCGAKQAPAPAVSQAANAKTVMGYGGQELEALRAQAAAANAARGLAPAPKPAPLPPAPEPFSPHADAATVLVAADPAPAPRPHTPSAGGYSPPAAYTAPAPAFTPPAPAYTAPAPAFTPPAPAYSPPGGGYSPPGGGYRPQPIAPVAAAVPPYLASQTAARAGRPIEPWQDTIRIQMFIWGALLLLAFCTPLSLDPMSFHWDTIMNAAGKAKLLPLILVAVGALSVAIASIPMTAPARGGIAAVLGLSGILVPLFMKGMPPWQGLVSVLGMVLLVPSLLARDQYRDAPLPRILVTVGVVAVLLPTLLPQNGNIPFVAMFQRVLDAGGQYKVVALVQLLMYVVAALALLAWLPSPASGASKGIAWTLLMWPLLLVGSTLFLDGGIDPTKAPYGALAWLAGGGLVIGSAFLAIASYGIATILGKQLE